MRAGSDDVVAYLRRHGNSSEYEVIRALGGGPRAEVGVFVAVQSGAVERVTLMCGLDELRLTGGVR